MAIHSATASIAALANVLPSTIVASKSCGSASNWPRCRPPAAPVPPTAAPAICSAKRAPFPRARRRSSPPRRSTPSPRLLAALTPCPQHEAKNAPRQNPISPPPQGLLGRAAINFQLGIFVQSALGAPLGVKADLVLEGSSTSRGNAIRSERVLPFSVMRGNVYTHAVLADGNGVDVKRPLAVLVEDGAIVGVFCGSRYCR